MFTSSAFSVPHSRHRARLSVPSLHESSYSLGEGGLDCPCWADLTLLGLTMVELCCYINIYFSLVSLPFCLLLQPHPSESASNVKGKTVHHYLLPVLCCWPVAVMTHTDFAHWLLYCSPHYRLAAESCRFNVWLTKAVHRGDEDHLTPIRIASSEHFSNRILPAWAEGASHFCHQN